MRVEIFRGSVRSVTEEFNSFCENEDIDIVKTVTSPVSSWDGSISISLFYKYKKEVKRKFVVDPRI